MVEKGIKWRIRKRVGREGWRKTREACRRKVTTCAMLLHYSLRWDIVS